MSIEQGVFSSIENHLRDPSNDDKMAKKKTKGRFSPKRGGPKSKKESKLGTPNKAKAATDEETQNFYEEDLHKNSLVWLKGDQGRGEWTQCTFLGESETGCRLRDTAGEEIVAPRKFVRNSNPSFLEGTAELTNLTYLNEPSVLHNVKYRYAKDQIYTRAGTVLIAVNPFKQLPIYSAEVARLYDSEPSGKEDPHVFEIAHRSYRELFETNKSQSVVISGESGSGKTENTKFVLKQLTEKSKEKGIDQAILQTNPILEAFGNAKTLRNNNSSRFGKLINIYFDSPTQISGADIRTYLLEKSRVVNAQEGERTYHIFYQLFKGSSQEARKNMGLTDMSQFKYLNRTNCFEVAGLDDAAEFAGVVDAFKTFGFDAGVQSNIFNLLAGILWLGNIEFSEEDTQSGEQAAKIKDQEPLAMAAKLMSVDKSFLERVITTRVIRARDEQMVKAMDLTQALNARDALAKYAYAALFEWLVKAMNRFIGRRKVEGRIYRDINLLDIYGFECFKVNSFEQLCINYANERLQQLFNRHLIEVEQREYEKENLTWKQIPYSGNDECLELLEDRNGLISILADEINIPQASDRTLARKLKDQLGVRSTFKDNARDPLRFSIAHYPGSVEYDTSNFLDKNRDNVHSDLLDLVSSNSESLLWTLTESCNFIRDQYQQMKTKRRQSTIRQHAVAATFKGQLTSLISTLSKTNVHYVRCIKPNSEQVPESFSSDLVLHQLKCCGVFEVVQMARAGYPTKFLYEDFSSRYSFLIGLKSKDTSSRGFKNVCKNILDHYNIDTSQYQLGETRLFLRAGALGKVEELQKLFISSAVCIQSFYRGFIARRRYLEYLSKVVAVQSCFRRWIAMKNFKILIKESRAAVKVQSNVRTFLAKRTREELLRAYKAEMLAKKEREEEAERAKAAVEREKKEERKKRKSKKKAKEQIKEEGSQPEISVAVESVPQQVTQRIDRDQSLQGQTTTPQIDNKAYQDLQLQLEKLKEENRNLSIALQQERELKLDFSEQLVVTEASYAQEFKAMKQTLGTIREYLAESMGETMLKKCMDIQEQMDDEILETGDATTRSMAHVDRISREFSRKASIFDDDAEFIEEVVEGQAVVENMDPVYELKNLKLRFEDWKDSYKRKLAYLMDCVKKNNDPNAAKLKGDQPKKKGLSKLLGFKRKS